jgi:hypothetical protein
LLVINGLCGFCAEKTAQKLRRAFAMKICNVGVVGDVAHGRIGFVLKLGCGGEDAKMGFYDSRYGCYDSGILCCDGSFFVGVFLLVLCERCCVRGVV